VVTNAVVTASVGSSTRRDTAKANCRF